MMDNLKGNSFASKKAEEQPASNKVVTTNIIDKGTTKKQGTRFFSEDAKTVGSHVLGTVLIPSLQKLLSDAVKNAIDWIIYGSKGTKTKPGVGSVSYTSFYQGPGYQQPGYSNPMVAPQNNIYAVNDIVFPNIEDAQNVLLMMREAIVKYGSIAVADFYDFISKSHTSQDYKYGWKDLSTADIIRVPDGYSIRFPRVIPLG